MDTYDFENKRIYRSRRNVTIDRMCRKPKALRRVAYLDTGEALDTQGYLERGYRAENLWAINRNPAEVAELSKTLDKLGLPRVHTVGLDFEEALERRVPEVDIIDFDGMSCIHASLSEQFKRIAINRQNAIYGLTFLAGREQGDERAFLSGFKNSDPVTTSFGRVVKATHRERLWMFLHSAMQVDVRSHGTFEDEIQKHYSEVARLEGRQIPCATHCCCVYWDVYVSTSGQPMVWCAVEVQPHRVLSSRDAMAFTRDGLFPPRCWVERCLQRSAEQEKRGLIKPLHLPELTAEEKLIAPLLDAIGRRDREKNNLHMNIHEALRGH